MKVAVIGSRNITELDLKRKFIPPYAAGIFHICIANMKYRRYFTSSEGTNFIEKDDCFRNRLFRWCGCSYRIW